MADHQNIAEPEDVKEFFRRMQHINTLIGKRVEARSYVTERELAIMDFLSYCLSGEPFPLKDFKSTFMPRQKTDLQAIWDERKKASPVIRETPPENFAQFLGMDKEQLEHAGLPELQNAAEDKGLVSEGGVYHEGFYTYSWAFKVKEPGEFTKQGERFYSNKGSTYEEAMVLALLAYWELIVLRKRQNG